MSPAELLAAFRREGCTSDRAAQACMAALALLEQARDILQEIVDTDQVEPGSPPEAALNDYLPDAIGMLTPGDKEDEDDDPPARPQLRVVGWRERP